MRELLFDLSGRRTAAIREEAARELIHLGIATDALRRAQELIGTIPMGSFHQEAVSLLAKNSVVPSMSYLDALQLATHAKRLRLAGPETGRLEIEKHVTQQESLEAETEAELQRKRTACAQRTTQASAAYKKAIEEANRVANHPDLPGKSEITPIGCGCFLPLLLAGIYSIAVAGQAMTAPADKTDFDDHPGVWWFILVLGVILCLPASGWFCSALVRGNKISSAVAKAQEQSATLRDRAMQFRNREEEAAASELVRSEAVLEEALRLARTKKCNAHEALQLLANTVREG